MTDAPNPLLCCRIATALSKIRDGDASASALWDEMRADYAKTEVKDADLEAAIAAKETDAVAAILDDWDADRRTRPAEDRALMKKALKAFRKRLKLTRLDDESRLGVGAMTKGGESAIVGITPPIEFAPGVWAEIAREGRLADCGDGLYGLADEGGGRKTKGWYSA